MMGQYIADDLSLAQEDPENENIRRALCNYLGNEDGNALYSEFIGMGEFDKVPAALDHTLLFDKIKWQYSPTMGFYCNSKAALAKVGKTQVHRMITTRMQLQKRGTGLELRFILQVDRSHWYYFNYNCDKQTLKIYSSIGEFNDLIGRVSEKNRTVDGKSGEGAYRYSLATKVEAENFSRHMTDMGNTSSSNLDEENNDDEQEDEE
jgi:hypothetical protein